MSSSNYQALTLKANGGKLLAINLSVQFVYSDRVATCNAVWNTGATGTCISHRIAQQMGLSPIGFTTVHTANGRMDVGQFIVDLVLPNKVVIKDLRVTEFSGGENLDALIGMDVICMGDMAITNANNQTVFSYRIPSDWAHIDYVAVSKPNKQGKLAKAQLKKNQIK